MKKLSMIGGSMLLMVTLIFGVNTPAFADENEISALKEQVEKLTKRIGELENEVKQAPTYVAPSGGAASGNAIEGALSGVRMTGYVQTGWGWNFNNPNKATSATTATREQSIRVFDQNEGFTLDAVKVALEKAAPETGGVGFRTDFLYGEDAEVITPTGSVVDEFDIEQAYVEARFPLTAFEGSSVLGDSLYMRAGKFVTLAGAEVIEAKDNWNASRSMMFGFAIPFTHTGVRSVYGLWDDKVKLTAGLNNGWDIVEDNNNYSTFEGQIAWAPNDKFLFTNTMYVGPENAGVDGHKRFLLDLVALYKVTDKLSLMANVDFGNERRVISGAEKANENAQWHGYALYARYQVNDKLAFATRAEIFQDDDVYRVGSAAVVGGVARERRYWEWTYTGEYKLYENLISRLEYRYDWSDTPIFQGESSQQTLSAQLIYNFA